MSMRRPYQIAGTIFLFFAAFIAYESLKLRYYTPLGPGPGFFSFWLGVLLFVLSLCSFLFAYQNYQTLNNNSAAIIFAPTVTVKSSPDEKSIDLFVLHEGTKVQIIDNIGVWYEIRISNGSIGWLPSSTVEKI